MKMNLKSLILMGTLAFGAFWGCAGTSPNDLGVTSGQFKPCPDSPNCVNSQTTMEDEAHFIPPLTYKGQTQDAFNAILSAVQSMDGSRIVTKEQEYLRVEFTSSLMGFVDDVEFYFPKESIIHVRSASRKGYSDFGVNRKRIEQIRVLFLN